jgi:hypothetical protein
MEKESLTLDQAIRNALTKLRTARFMQAIFNRFRTLLPAKMEKIPFAAVSDNVVFWWQGKPYIKENRDDIFDREPIPRPFPETELVEVESVPSA